MTYLNETFFNTHKAKNLSRNIACFRETLRIFANVNGKHCKGKAKMNAKQ